MKFSDKPAEVAVPSESKSNSEDKSRREVVSGVNSSNNIHVARSALSESSESTEEMVDDGDEDFVEALESLDLTQPDNLRIYTGEVFTSRERAAWSDDGSCPFPPFFSLGPFTPIFPL